MFSAFFGGDFVSLSLQYRCLEACEAFCQLPASKSSFQSLSIHDIKIHVLRQFSGFVTSNIKCGFIALALYLTVYMKVHGTLLLQPIYSI
jgi:hypothetical protein